MYRRIAILMILTLALMLPSSLQLARVNAAPAAVSAVGSVDVSPASPLLTAVDPLAWGMYGDVLPARPFLYSVDATGITITDNGIIPMKERVVDRFYDPITKLLRVITGR